MAVARLGPVCYDVTRFSRQWRLVLFLAVYPQFVDNAVHNLLAVYADRRGRYRSYISAY